MPIKHNTILNYQTYKLQHKQSSMGADANTLSIAAFTALGTIVGYLGTEVASASIFHRMLWPSRFYNTRSLKSLIAIVFLMPIGGPIHKAAVEALDRLVFAGLWKGYCRGDMLGTAFYNDTGHHYVMRMADGSKSERKAARNAFWITVLGLIPWQPRIDTVDPAIPEDDESAARVVQEVRAQRPVFVLNILRADSTVAENLPIVDGDIGRLKFRYIAAIIASEIITLAVGIVNATVWRSLFSIWYLAPLLLKLVGLFCRVRRKSVEPSSVRTAPEDGGKTPLSNRPKDEQLLCEVEDFSKGFLLIEGPSELVLQFFRHYGHPIRHRKGAFGDRVREVISMFTVIGSIVVYPGGLIAFIFAPTTIQWVWLGYQLYAMLAMHLYRFGEAEHIGTTQEWIARELSSHNSVCFDDGSGNRVVVQLGSSIASSVSEGRRKVEHFVRQKLRDHAQNSMATPSLRPQTWPERSRAPIAARV